MKNILFVSSEAVPYVKTGGLADVVGSLPRYFNKDEYDVRVIIPLYECMDKVLRDSLTYLCHVDVTLNWRKKSACIYEGKYAGVTYYFVENDYYFAGDKPYNNIYEDVEKFAFFAKAVLTSLPFIKFNPAIIHCHDWQTGLVPVFLHAFFGYDEFYHGIKCVFSIHNMQFQGRWKINEVMDITGLPKQIFNSNELESYGEANYLKGAIVYSDAITTVSKTYANDIMTVEGGEGLDGLLSAKSAVLHGIVNGLDYGEYNPLTDSYIHENYSSDNFARAKKLNKAELQRRCGLPVDDDVFLIGMVSRMSNQKGFDIVNYVMEEMLNTMNVQFVVLGTGEYKYEESFRYFTNKYPDKIHATIDYSEAMAHQIYASADAFLMPSLFEPCGLSQLMAMRYGTLPIVRETGGLKDTVSAYNEFEDSGTGFSFSGYNAHEMLHVIKYANDVFSNNKSAWASIMKRAMEADFSWDKSAREYEKLYQSTIIA